MYYWLLLSRLVNIATFSVRFYLLNQSPEVCLENQSQTRDNNSPNWLLYKSLVVRCESLLLHQYIAHWLVAFFSIVLGFSCGLTMIDNLSTIMPLIHSPFVQKSYLYSISNSFSNLKFPTVAECCHNNIQSRRRFRNAPANFDWIVHGDKRELWARLYKNLITGEFLRQLQLTSQILHLNLAVFAVVAV